MILSIGLASPDKTTGVYMVCSGFGCVAREKIEDKNCTACHIIYKHGHLVVGGMFKGGNSTIRGAVSVGGCLE